MKLLDEIKKVNYLESIPCYHNGEEGYLISNSNLFTTTWIASKTLETMNMKQFELATNQGKNTQQISRVTGYYSVVQNWNAGKKAELLDRHKDNL